MNAAATKRAHLLAWMLCWTCTASAQSVQTPNTLMLDRADKRPRATLDDVRLLVGHWRGDFLGGVGEEVWLPPAGGTMVGVFRLYRQDAVVFYETMPAVEEEGSVSLRLKHFHPDLKGWEEKNDTVTFRLVRSGRDAVWFEGLTYRRLPDGSLQGFIAIESKDGRVREESFTLKPVRTWSAARPAARGRLRGRQAATASHRHERPAPLRAGPTEAAVRVRIRTPTDRRGGPVDPAWGLGVLTSVAASTEDLR